MVLSWEKRFGGPKAAATPAVVKAAPAAPKAPAKTSPGRRAARQ
jgi:hypothetical protein